METTAPASISVHATVNAPVNKVWEFWTSPDHITKWNNASDDWHSPRAQNDLRKGGNFLVRMEAKDGSFGFDFGGIYDEVDLHKTIKYTMGDGRKVEVLFKESGNNTEVTETFDAENLHSVDMQRTGWQAILDNFKKYAESSAQ